MAWEDKRLVLVEWGDAGCENSWQSPGSTFRVTKVWTIGLVVYEDAEVVSVAGSIQENGDFNQVMTIPRSCIASIEDVK